MPASDLELLKKADDFECWYSDYEKNALDSMLKQVDAPLPKPLTIKQRLWVERLIEQLETRSSADD
jgi:hypothetical protein